MAVRRFSTSTITQGLPRSTKVWDQVSALSFTVEYLIVGGGGGSNGGTNAVSYGGGAGGGLVVTGSVSTALSTNYSATVGAGGPAGVGINTAGSNGVTSSYNGINATAGNANGIGTTGGSNALFSGGTRANPDGAGGAGAGGNGSATNGGIGVFSSITGTSVGRGGGGSGSNGTATSGGGVSNYGSGNPGTVNTGGGGGGGGGAGGSGGSGIVILKYPDTKTITIGAGLTGTTASPSGGFKVTSITAGTGNVSWA